MSSLEGHLCIEVTFVEAAVVDSIFFSYKIDGSVMATVSTFQTTSSRNSILFMLI